MKNMMKMTIVLMAGVLTFFTANAQRIEIGLSPLAVISSIPKAGPTFRNAYGMQLGVSKTDTSVLQFQVRYDYFDAKFDTLSGYDNSFHCIGIGVGRSIIRDDEFTLSGWSSLGFTSSIREPISRPTGDSLTKYSSYESKAPSSVTISLGVQAEWMVTRRVVPYLEAMLLNSIKMKSNEHTRPEVIALRLGLRLKL